ncbi:hypothetical protein BDP55DRAFT_747318 [Colletotrichum godetiae]|uniref:Uncharacterized protein n=1 Tax=Colletotrichum godetiae TaxID=1209918 RepID=A0AAJ0AI58_9PEZI|nr:uncharacterized protein BDP55DRAFT_747318 [Colletotrichum godetiae]KAK1673700.1 hypothetical protein BDP55DRAFT_747318 [Colletotrichum godetiae]
MPQQVQSTQQFILTLAQSRDEAKLMLVDSFREQQKTNQRKTAEIVSTEVQISNTGIEWLIEKQETESVIVPKSSVQQEASRAVISLNRLVKILSALFPDRIPAQNTAIDLNVLVLRQRNLQHILQNTPQFDPRAESRAHTALNEDRPYNDDWYGPSGMIRSLIAQILLALIKRNSLDLGCLDRRSYVRGLEHHDLGILCDLLSDLVCQFDAETTIYVIDGVSKFDVDHNNIFQRFEVAIRRLGDIVKDDELGPRLKILMTVPFRSSVRLKNIVDTKFQPALLQQLLAPNKLSIGSIVSSILSRSTLQNAATTSSLQNDLPEWGGGDYDDEYIGDMYHLILK